MNSTATSAAEILVLTSAELFNCIQAKKRKIQLWRNPRRKRWLLQLRYCGPTEAIYSARCCSLHAHTQDHICRKASELLVTRAERLRKRRRSCTELLWVAVKCWNCSTHIQHLKWPPIIQKMSLLWVFSPTWAFSRILFLALMSQFVSLAMCWGEISPNYQRLFRLEKSAGRLKGAASECSNCKYHHVLLLLCVMNGPRIARRVVCPFRKWIQEQQW